MNYKFKRGIYINDKLISIQGYKSFNSDGTNMHGKKFIPGVRYHCDGEIKFGVHGNGYHFAYNMEDTIRYSGSDTLLKDVSIAEVIGSGNIVESFDNYNGYDYLFVCSDLEIIRYLTRDEIITLALNLPPTQMERFVSLFRLTEEEQELFYYISASVARIIDYYQRNIKDTYYNDEKYRKFKR